MTDKSAENGNGNGDPQSADLARIEARVKSDFHLAKVALAMEIVAPSLGHKIDALTQQNADLARQNDDLKITLDRVLQAVIPEKAAGGA